jgi:hypothetical protein
MCRASQLTAAPADRGKCEGVAPPENCQSASTFCGLAHPAA